MERSPLSRLPSELRLAIFEHVFTFDRMVWQHKSWSIVPKGKRIYRPLSKALGATLVCKQMRKETLDLPFLLNTPVFGNEVGDFSPYYEWYLAPPLKDTCTQAYNVLSKITHVVPESTTFKLHLWVYPLMSEPRTMSESHWAELSDTFKALVSVLGAAKLIIILHFQYSYDNLGCKSPVPRYLIEHGEAMFEVRQGDTTGAKQAIALLGASIEDKLEELQRHEDHNDINLCRINHHKHRVSTQLMQAEQVSRTFLNLAARASIPEGTSLDLSDEVTGSSSFSGPQELRRDSARSVRAEHSC